LECRSYAPAGWKHGFRTPKTGSLVPFQTVSETDKAAWRAAKQQRLANLGKQLKVQASTVQDSDAFKRYLAAQAVFHHHSARNVFLILYQRPEATRVAGYTTWRKMGRQVRRSERGITIFAPAPSTPRR
jgi:hypothetical protein